MGSVIMIFNHLFAPTVLFESIEAFDRGLMGTSGGSILSVASVWFSTVSGVYLNPHN